MTPALTKRLRDARTACTHIAAFTAGRTLDDYLTDVMLRSAVERQIEILGEALNQARRIDATLADRLPRLHQSIAMRHRIIHGYDMVDDELVWMATQVRIPLLQEQLGAVLRDLPPDDAPTGR